MFDFRLTDGECDGTGVVELLVYNARAQFLHHPHDPVHHHIREIIFYDLLHQFLHLLGLGNGYLSRSTISHNQSTRSQVDPAIVPDHHDEDIGQFIGIDLTEYRLSGCGRWFTIVHSPEKRPFSPQHIGIAYVAGIKIFPTVIIHQSFHLVDGLDMVSKSEELAPFLGVISLGYFIGYGQEGVDGGLWVSIKFVYDKTGTQFGLEPCSLGRHDLTTVGNVHNLLHGNGIKGKGCAHFTTIYPTFQFSEPT